MKFWITSVAAIFVLAAVARPVSADNLLSGLFGHGIKGSGDRVTESRDLPDFTKIRTRGACDVYVTFGDTRSVSITFDDNLIDLIKTEVKGKTLRIYSDESYNSRKSCKVEITVPKLVAIKSSGSGDFELSGFDDDSFDFSLSGSGDLTIDGRVKELEISISGSGDVDARRLIADEAYVSISGSGDVLVHAKSVFDGSVSGSGDITFYGEPKDISRSVRGSGSIRRR